MRGRRFAELSPTGRLGSQTTTPRQSPEDCAMHAQSRERKQVGLTWRAVGGAYVCLCAGPSNVSDNFEQDLVKVEADLEARLHENPGRSAKAVRQSLP